MNVITLSEEQRNRLTDDEFNKLEENASLLDTGGWGDCVVSCGGTRWRRHSDILCERSDYFRAAFQGGFKEGEYKFLNLKDVVTSWFVELIIKYIYLSIPRVGYDLEIYGPMNDSQFYEIVLELYRHADFFKVKDLKDAIMRELRKRLDASAMILFNVGRDALDPALTRRALQDPMAAAVSAFDKSNLYYDFYEPVRTEIFRFVERCYPVLSGMGEQFDDYLRQAPELSLAILKRMSHIENSRLITPGPQVLCQFCNSRINVGPPGFRYQPEFGITADRNGSVRYFCSSSECFRKIRVKSCFSGE